MSDEKQVRSTPPPWTAGDKMIAPAGYVSIDAEGFEGLALVSEDNKANIPLITTAPLMFVALRRLADYEDSVSDCENCRTCPKHDTEANQVAVSLEQLAEANAIAAFGRLGAS